MFRGGRVLGWGTSGHLGSDVTAGGVSEGGAWTIIDKRTRSSLPHRPQLPTSCAYQPPSPAGVRLAAARVLGRAVASLSLDTAQQSARAKARPRACCWLAVGACPGRRIHSAHSRALVYLDHCACRSARRAMPPLSAFSEVTLPCAGYDHPCPRACCIAAMLAMPCCHRPAHHHLAHMHQASKSSSKSPSFLPRVRQSSIVNCLQY